MYNTNLFLSLKKVFDLRIVVECRLYNVHTLRRVDYDFNKSMGYLKVHGFLKIYKN